MPPHMLTRRLLLQVLGASAIAAGCGGSDDTGGTPTGTGGPHPGTDAGTGPTSEDAGAPVDQDAAPVVQAGTPEQLLATIETIIVVMMENRSFDHILGSLARDAGYPAKGTVAGTQGTETNPAPDGGAPVAVYKLDDFTPADLPHSWDASHAQFDGGKNDGFVIAHKGASQNETMGYHDRSQLPLYYWLADNFTVCDHWFASVMGPTWPNRYYLHAATSVGKKTNDPFFSNAPPTIWDRFQAAGKTAKNYYAGGVAWFTGAFPTKAFGSGNPTKPISDFFNDAKNGTLPNFAIIDPDFQANDDHPDHSVKLGQAFISTIFQALAASPQWEKCLLVITYDEHGGFFDHVPPPVAADDIAEFRQYGFRVPAFVIGPRVKKGYVSSVPYDHTSVLSTAAARYSLQSLTTRDYNAKTLVDCLDPMKWHAPTPAPSGAPSPQIGAADLRNVGVWSQPELEKYADARSPESRVHEWLKEGARLGALTLI